MEPAAPETTWLNETVSGAPPMTLGNAAAARVRLIVWCKACGHRAEPGAAGMAERYGAETTIPEWRARTVFLHCRHSVV